MVTTLDESQVTYLDPAGFITRENGCDMRDATTYKFILLACGVIGNTTDFDSVVLGSIPSTPAKQFCSHSLMVKTRAYTSPKHRPDKPECAGSTPAGGTSYRSLTQLDRVPVFETGSRGFESCRAGHINMS